MSDDVLIANVDLAEAARTYADLKSARATLKQAQQALEAERAARQNADRRERAAASVINAARIACERSLFPGRGVLVATIAMYDDAVQKVSEP